MRCGRCGNENSEGNRFCGMCGTPLVPKAQTHVPVAPSPGRREDPVRATEEIRVPARAASDTVPEMAPPIVSRTVVTSPTPIGGSAVPSVVPPVVAPPPRERADSPAVYGPSFLGLNRPPDGRSGDGLQAGSGHRSGNLDYLLEDEEEPKRGWGKLLVVVIALGLIGGFGYLRWKQGGFNFLKLGAGTQSAQNVPDSAGSPSASSATRPTPSADTSNPASQNSGTGSPASTGTTAVAPSTTESGTNGSGGPTPGSSPTSGADAGAQPTAPSGSPSAAAAPDNSSAGKPQEDAPAEKTSDADSAEDAEAGPSKTKSHAMPSPVAPAAKPSAARARERKPTPVTPVDTTAEAARYIYGRGVPQDCDVGLRMLKPAAQTNPKAMITLGTLYSSGTCTPRDLPTAYRWYAMALHKQPDNQTLQDDLQQLWSQMTPPERQLAIKLSQ